jgi:hypothetical protein
MKTTHIKLSSLIAVLYFLMLTSCFFKTSKNDNNNCSKSDTNLDITNPINIGKLDDRTCKHIYTEVFIEGEKWGKYEVSENSSTDGVNSARMERIFDRVEPKNGAYQDFTAICRIQSVSDGKKGTYIVQTKGKHIGHTNVDPAICLVAAKKRIENGVTYFDLYSEQITKRGGRLSQGTRQNIKLATVKKNEPFRLEMKTGFSGTPINQHYVSIKIKDKEHWMDVPDPQIGTETGIRYGAYSVDEGKAIVFFRDTHFKSYDGN